MARKSYLQVHGEDASEYMVAGTQSPLSERERTILLLVAEGKSNREIAEELILSPTTVKWYLEQTYQKLGARRRTQAVKLAADLHLIETESPKADPTPGIPVPLTKLIGRERDAREITQLLNDPEIRLVTLLGTGGTGKTRLAIEIAQEASRQTPGQVCFVPLEAVSSLSGLVQAVASAIGFQFHGASDLGRQLLLGLRNRKLLLVMDNVEHLAAAGKFIHEMLAAAPRLKILTTSRERLNLSAETVYSLQGLDTPPAVGHAEKYAAFRLFIRVARYSQPNFQPDNDDVIHICRICQLTEGMPLAIELAARWIDLLTPEQILEEISRGINILQTTRRDIPERHQSIRAVFEHSWRLLSAEERQVFQKLSVFCGGFDRTAAENVAGATLFIISALVDKSLLMRVDKDRFKFHELVRQFAGEKLQADPEEYALTLDEHCRYYANLMAFWEREVKADISALGTSILGVQADYENIMASWRHALDVPLVPEIGKYVVNITLSFSTHGLTPEAEKIFAHAVRLFDARNLLADASDRIRVMTHYGWCLIARGQFERARQMLEDANGFAQALDNSHAADVGLLLALLGLVLYSRGELDAGRERAKQGLITCQSVNFQLGVWLCLSILGELEIRERNYEAAYGYHQMALTYSEKQESFFNIPYNLGALGWICCRLGKIDEALAYLRRGLIINRNLLNIDPVLFTVLGIAGLYEQHSQAGVALELLAIILHHPQYGLSSLSQPFIGSMAQVLQAQLESQFPSEHIKSVMERAKQGQLSSCTLDPHFIVTPELVDRLLELLDQVENL
jgi:predicted ATPase/DNA-binding CsgD family transcriptional regulator